MSPNTIPCARCGKVPVRHIGDTCGCETISPKPSDGAIVIDTPQGIEAFRLLSIRARLKLEIRGLKSRGGSVYALVKREFKLKGNRESVLAQFENILRNRGVLSGARVGE